MKNLRSAPLFEFKRPYGVVLIPVCLEDMGNNQFIPAGNLKVDIAVPPWIDYRCPSTGSNEIGIMGYTLRNNPFE
jgi:hypothetical protein